MDEARDQINHQFTEKTWQELKTLCKQPTGVDKHGKPAVIPDKDIETIAGCLRDLKKDEFSERPRTYAVLCMTKRLDLMAAFVGEGLLDNSFPYPDRRSLPSVMKRDPDACHAFLNLQRHVMSPVCQMEQGAHWKGESGDLLFRHIRDLGRGGGGTRVDEVQSKVSKSRYARKRMPRSNNLLRGKGILESFENELKIMKKLDHTHLVKVFSSYTDAKWVAIIMKPIADMDLKSYLRDVKDITGTDRERFRTYYGCLTSAVKYLHDNQIRHKDIKPGNVLLRQGEIYITDFGTAREWEGDGSMTSGPTGSRTMQYQSPEVARGIPRGTPSDIWSLGVTFLEMTTVLRGETPEAMYKFLSKTADKEEHVWANLPGAAQWMELLRQNKKYARLDNTPIQWIRDMLAEKWIERPSAGQMLEKIREAAEGAFWGCKYCRSDESGSSDIASDCSEGEEDDNIRPTSMKDSGNSCLNNKKQQARPQSMQVETVAEDPLRSAIRLTQSRLQKIVLRLRGAWWSRLSLSNLSTYFLPHLEEVQDIDQTTHVQELVRDYDSYSCELLGASPSMSSKTHTATEDSVIQASSMQTLYGAIEMSPALLPGSEIIYSEPLETPAISQHRILPQSPKAVAGEQTPATEKIIVVATMEQSPDIDAAIDASERKNDASIPEEVMDLPPKGSHRERDARESTGSLEYSELDEIVSGAKRNPFLGPNKRPTRRRSDEFLRIGSATKALLKDLERGLATSDDTSIRLRGRCTDTDASRNAMIAELKEFKIELRQKSSSKAPESHGSPSHKDNVPEALPLQARVEDYDEKILNSPQRSVLMDDVADVPTFDPNIPMITSNRTERRLSPVRAPPCNSPAIGSSASLEGARHPSAPKSSSSESSGVTRLTINALHASNEQLEHVSSTKRSPPPAFRMQSATNYSQKMYKDAASSVPTSVRSAKTRAMSFLGLMLPLQDRSADYLGQHTKAGKAHAVRLLLREGCNPGNKKYPRLGPIFNAVRGASFSHNECLRALIDHGVDLNVRSRRTGKTPLIEALEREPWPGYLQTMILLLSNGANPNMKDSSGDVPLLKLLGGGFEPLDKYNCDALALLLRDEYRTKIDVTPCGTKNQPLHLAIQRCDPWAVGFILKKQGCKIEAENSEGLTPLLLAVTSCSTNMTDEKLKILDLLLEMGANPNVRMEGTQKTPLHIAVACGLVHAVQRLLEHRADPRSLTKSGKSTFRLARTRRALHDCHGCDECLSIQDLLTAALVR